MDTAKLEELLATVGKEKRAELIEKLEGAQDEHERLEIAKQYVAAADAEEPAWLAESYELSDDELSMVAGGVEMPWDNEVDDNCCS